MQTWTLIVDSFRESRDKKMFWVLLFISTVVAAALACVGFDENGWSFFFGAIQEPDAVMRRGSPQALEFMGALVSHFLVGLYIGWIGVIASLVATAGFFPRFMEGGAIAVVLSKPMSRAAIFAGKYVGSLAFVLIQSVYFVLLTFLVLRWHLGVWLWEYLWAIPLLVLLYSYIYCVCVLVAVWTRSTLTSLTCTLLFWFSVAGVAGLDSFLSSRAMRNGPSPREDATLSWTERSTLSKMACVGRAIFPKTDEIPVILGNRMKAGTLTDFMLTVTPQGTQTMSEQDRRELAREERRMAGISTVRSVGSSLVFEAVILVLAWWSFSRKDF